MAEFKKALLADSLPQMDAMQQQFQNCAQRAEQTAQERKNAEKENSPESQANIKAGEGVHGRPYEDRPRHQEERDRSLL